VGEVHALLELVQAVSDGVHQGRHGEVRFDALHRKKISWLMEEWNEETGRVQRISARAPSGRIREKQRDAVKGITDWMKKASSI
jgi:hypothetical protein